MAAILSTSQIRQLEQSLKHLSLMHRAAHEIAQWLCKHTFKQRSILFLIGPGNNGVDAFLAALLLAKLCPDLSIHVSLIFDNAHVPNIIKENLKQNPQAHNLFIHTVSSISDYAAIVSSTQNGDKTSANISKTKQHDSEKYKIQPDWIVDGLFGIGLSRPISGLYAHVIQSASNQKRYGSRILAVDIPSGLDADQGNIVANPHSTPSILAADYTLTFIAHKPGLYMGSGRDVAGQVILADLDLPKNHLPPPYALLNEPDLFQAALPQRYHASNKGSYGTLGIIGGSKGMLGAPLLCGRAALFCGTGKVAIGFAEQPAPLVDFNYPELMLADVETLFSSHFLKKIQVLLLGPGLGMSAEKWLAHALTQPTPCLLDADALNQLATSDALQQSIAIRKANNYRTILTPHPLEAARLLKCTIEDIQNARIAAAEKLAHQFGATVILKGSGTVIYEIQHTPVINPTGSGALATAGTGDVLAGILAALIAQGMDNYLAACAGVWLHGMAADDLVRENQGPIGLNASALPQAVRRRLNTLIAY